MRKEIITSISQDGLDSHTSVFVFTVHDDSINLIEKIKEAAAAYINTDIGLQEYQHNCKNFNWGDFLQQFRTVFFFPMGLKKIHLTQWSILSISMSSLPGKMIFIFQMKSGKS